MKTPRKKKHHHHEKQLAVPVGRYPNQGEIAVAAYFLWEQLGKPDGRDVECWLAGELALIDSGYRPVE